MLVRDVMSREVVVVSPEESFASLIEKLITHNFHTLPVINAEGNIVGLVNFEDIMKIFISHNPALEKLLKTTHLYNAVEEDILESELPADIGAKLKISDIMETNVVTVEGDENLSGARRLMKQYNRQKMPVVKDGKLVGFITLFDIIVAVLREKGIIR